MASYFPDDPASQTPANTWGPLTTPLANTTNQAVYVFNASSSQWTVQELNAPTANTSVTTPSITSPTEDQIVPLTNDVNITSSAYTTTGNPGVHTSSNWQIYQGLANLESTNSVTGVTTTADNWATVPNTAADPGATFQQLASNGNGQVIFFGSGSGGGNQFLSQTTDGGQTYSTVSFSFNGISSRFITYQNEKYFLSTNSLLSSGNSDGTVWTDTNLSDCNCVGWWPGQNVYVATRSQSNGSQGGYSSDGITFTTFTWPDMINPSVFSTSAESMAANDNVFLMGGSSGQMWRATNTSNWTKIEPSPFGSGTIQVIFWSESLGLFFMGGNGGILLTSPDGVDWTLRDNNAGTGQIMSIIESPDGTIIILVLAADDTPQLMTTRDGVSYSPLESPTPSSPGAFTIVFDGTYYFMGRNPAETLSATEPINVLTLSIAGALTDGFKPGDAIINLGGFEASGSITVIDNSIVKLQPFTGTWTGNGTQRIRTNPNNYNIVLDQTSTSNLTTITFSKDLLIEDAEYRVRVAYRSSANVVSEYSPYVTFKTT